MDWAAQGSYRDVRYETAEGIAKVTIDRADVRNALRPGTTAELIDALDRARHDGDVGAIVLTGAGDRAFCSGGDQKSHGADGHVEEDALGRRGIGETNVIELQSAIRRCPKPVVAMVAGFAIGAGNVLHVCCDLTIAADNATFGQTGPRVGSFDGGYGANLLARQIGAKRAREMWFLCRRYDAERAYEMGLVNAVVPLDRLEAETLSVCRELLAMSPTALRLLKASFNAADDGLAGLQQLANDATQLYYATDEAQEGTVAFNEKREPDFGRYPRRP